MTIKFLKVIIHHFLSFDHAELDLTDKGYCLVSGINRSPKDSAKSNGSGKSTIFNAISYALTGETLQGLKSNIANIYFNDGCYVQLDFEIDGHKYSLIRSKEDDTYGTNLKITVDGEDKSGKGIRESQVVLDQLLPDLTSELLGSVIMIGQGMPMKFTANTPSGRKEVLEHLSQSDFMIQDLKNRIASRSTELNIKLRSVEDTILTNTSQLEVYNKQLSSANEELTTKFGIEPDFEKELSELNTKLTEEKSSLKFSTDKEIELNKKLEELNPKYISLLKEKENYAKKFLDEHTAVQEKYRTDRYSIVSKEYSLSQEIEKLDSITDICPTCGQKIPGAVKPDTSTKKSELQSLREEIKKYDDLIAEDNNSYNKIVEELKNRYDIKLNEIQSEQGSIQRELHLFKVSSGLSTNNIQDIELKIAVINKNKEFFNQNKEQLLNRISDLSSKIIKIQEDLVGLQNNKTDVINHIEVIKKMTTIVTRDFRGFLLKNIIDYISVTAKEYASKIFGCNEIEFVLNGNDIDISFCNKDYENLSGGEKQRVDLIVQFSIRKFMEQYLQFSSNILVLDEITDALDVESCDKVINFITAELSDIESIFIISHHADELQIPVDSEIVVEKNGEGVSSLL